MSTATAIYVVSATDDRAGNLVYFNDAGQWTSDRAQAQIARSAIGRKALLRVAAALANDNSVHAANLAEAEIPFGGLVSQHSS